jgi:hypothetical protein
MGVISVSFGFMLFAILGRVAGVIYPSGFLDYYLFMLHGFIAS